MGAQGRMLACDHPLQLLVSGAGNAGQRGVAGVSSVSCSKCKLSITGPRAVAVFMASCVIDSVSLWRALRALGHKETKAQAKAPEPVSSKECEHYLPWLQVAGSEAPAIGCNASLSIRCQGCNSKWGQGQALPLLLPKLIEDRRRLKAAIRKLGGSP